MARSGTLEIKLLGDTKDLNRALGKAQRDLSDFAKGAGAAFAAGGVIAGAVFAKSFGDALEGEQIEDRLEASLSPTSKIAGEAGEIASRVYAGAWGDSLDEVANAVGVVASTLTDLDATGVEEATQKAFDLANAFEVDIGEAVNTVGVLLNTGLVGDADQAFDLIARAFQEVPAEMRQELPQILEEYSQNFAALGIEGPEAFGLIVDAAAGGRFEIDKTGDAIKEFADLATEDVGTVGEAYEQIGLDASEMADMVATGGDQAREALGLVVDGLLAIQDPSEQAAAAAAFFGEPIKDLSVQDIPLFLQRLDDMDGGLGDVEGAATAVGDTVNDNLKTRWDSAIRSAQETLRTWIDQNVLPGATQIVDAFGEGGVGGVIDKVVELWREAQPKVEAWWNETFTPWWESTAVPWMEWMGSAMGNALINALIESVVNALPNVLTQLGDMIESAINRIPGVNLDISPDFNVSVPNIPMPDRPTTAPPSSGGSTYGGGGTVGGAGGFGSRAHGGSVTRGPWLVGERGPELLTMPGMGRVTPIRRGGGGRQTVNNITINMPPGSDGDDVVQKLRRWNRVNGPVPVSVSG